MMTSMRGAMPIAMIVGLGLALAFADTARAAPGHGPGRLRGTTFELGVGLGVFSVDSAGEDGGGGGYGAGVSLGLGRFLGDRLALGARLSSVIGRAGGETEGAALIMPAAQWWVDRQLWLGAAVGAGVATAVASSSTSKGLAFELRFGISPQPDRREVTSYQIVISSARGDHQSTFTLLATVGIQTM